MKHKGLIFSALFLFTSVLFAQGTSESSSSASSGEKKISGEITFLTVSEFTQSPEADLYKAAADFEKKYPGTKVTIQSLTGKEVVSKYTTAALAGGGPDVVALDNAGWPINMAAMGLLKPLTEEIKETGNPYLEGPLASGTYEGELYSVPWYYNNTGLYYNKRILTEIGYDHPPKDWPELEDCVKKATEKGYVGITTRLDGYHVFNAFMAQDNPVIDATGDMPVVTVNNESGKAAFNFYAGLESKYHAFPESMKEATSWAKAYIPFIQDKSLFLICGDWAYANVKKGNPDLSFGISQMPKGKIQAACLGGYNLCINKNTKNFDTAWAFISYLTSKECDYVLFGQGRVPARSDVDYTSVLKNNPDFQVFIDNGPITKPRPLVVNASKVDELVSNAFAKVLFGAQPQDALDELEKDLNEFIKENYK